MTHHDAGHGGGHTPLQHLQSVARHLLGGGSVGALSGRGHHGGLQQDSLVHHVVLGHEAESLRPHHLRDLQSPVNAVGSVEEDLGLHDGDEAIVLQSNRRILPS